MLKKWEIVINTLKINLEVCSDPEILNIYFIVKMLFLELSNNVLCKMESQHKIFMINNKEMTLEEISHLIKNKITDCKDFKNVRKNNAGQK